jgi:Nucleotidyltransferase
MSSCFAFCVPDLRAPRPPPRAQHRSAPGPARSLGPAWRAVLPAFYRRPGGLRWIPAGGPPARTGGSGISAFPPASQLPIDEQVDYLRAAATRNPTLTEVLSRAAELDLPGWYLVAGALCQTVWNVTTGQPPEAGILDYDLVYFGASGNRGLAAEDQPLRRWRAMTTRWIWLVPS